MKKEPKKTKAAAEKKQVKNTGSVLLIKNPRITEKATMHAEGNVYTFDVSPFATKPEIGKAIQALYKVTQKKINVITIRAKKVFVRGKKGKKSGGKKAMVYLKKGEKIEIA